MQITPYDCSRSGRAYANHPPNTPIPSGRAYANHPYLCSRSGRAYANHPTNTPIPFAGVGVPMQITPSLFQENGRAYANHPYLCSRRVGVPMQITPYDCSGRGRAHANHPYLCSGRGRAHANRRYPSSPSPPRGERAAAAGPKMAALARLGPALARGRGGIPGVVPGVPGGVPGVPVRAMAGHNRWSKVRHVKGPRDAERSRLRQRLARMLRAAAAEGGAEPALNPALAALLERCRSLNVPKATIENALRPERPAAAARALLTARGPGGALLLLDVRTDNVRRSQAELRTLLGRHGSVLTAGGTPGCDPADPCVTPLTPGRAALAGDARGAFEAVAVLRVSGRAVAMEAALEAAAAAGAQDVAATEDGAELQFLCDPSSLGSVRRGLAAAGLRPLSAELRFRPRAALALPAGARAAAERLLRALAGRPDLAGVFHNLQDVPEVTPAGHSPLGGHSDADGHSDVDGDSSDLDGHSDGGGHSDPGGHSGR
ncbi:translational activator of cytochrome c oxidase 1 [Lonchura striata]